MAGNFVVSAGYLTLSESQHQFGSNEYFVRGVKDEILLAKQQLGRQGRRGDDIKVAFREIDSKWTKYVLELAVMNVSVLQLQSQFKVKQTVLQCKYVKPNNRRDGETGGSVDWQDRIKSTCFEISFCRND